MVPKPKHEWDVLDRKKVQLNAKAVLSYIVLLIEMNLIVFGIVSRLKKFGNY